MPDENRDESLPQGGTAFNPPPLPRLSRTHTTTYTVLPISRPAFEEIRSKLLEAENYERMGRDPLYGVTVDLNGILLSVDEPDDKPEDETE